MLTPFDPGEVRPNSLSGIPGPPQVTLLNALLHQNREWRLEAPAREAGA